jgi:hypothetical protein
LQGRGEEQNPEKYPPPDYSCQLLRRTPEFCLPLLKFRIIHRKTNSGLKPRPSGRGEGETPA